MTSKDRLDSLTSARFFAALGVLLVHYQYASAEFLPGWTAKTGLGAAGVTFFFVLSGFILTYNYLPLFKDGINPRTLRGYFVARAARIIPVYLATFAFGLAAVILMRGSPAVHMPLTMQHLDRWMAAAVLNLVALHPFIPISWVQNAINAPAWSVGCEVFFYAVFPPFVASIARYSVRRIVFLASCLFILQLMLHEIIVHFAVGDATGAALLESRLWIDRFPLFRVFEFLIGCCAGHVFLNSTSRKGDSLLGWAALSYVLIEICRIFFGSTNFPRLTLMGPAFAFAIYGLGSGTSLLRFLQRPIMRLLGESSYALYLVHWTPLMLLEKTYGVGKAPLTLTALTALVSVIGSILLYWTFERPLRQWIRLLAQDRRS